MAEAAQVTRTLVFKNGVFSAAAWLFPIILGLIATPIIIDGLGLDAYGIFAIIMGFVSYSFTFGIGRSAAKYVAELRSSGQIEKMSESLSAVLVVSVVLGLFVVVLVGSTGNWLVSEVLMIPAASNRIAANALNVASVTILITMISQVFQFILQGLHRFDRFLFLTNLGGLLLTAGNVALVMSGFGVLALVIWNCLLVFITCVLFLFATRKLLPEFSFRITIRAEVWRSVIAYAASIVGYQVFGNALLLFERGWITRKFGTEALTFYVVPMALGFYFHGLVASLVVVLFPVVNQMLNDKDKLLRIYKTASKIILSLTVLFVTTMVFGGREFLFVWLGQSFVTASYAILVIHAFTFAFLAIMTISWQLTESFGMAKANAIAGAAWMVVSAPLMVVLSERWQTEGVAAARLIGVFSLISLVVYVEKSLLGGPGLKFWTGAGVRLLGAACAACATQFLITSFMHPGWPALIALSILGTIVFVVVLIGVGFFEEDERNAVLDLVSGFRNT